MHTGVYRIADRRIGITSQFSAVHKLCRDYATRGTPDFSVVTTQADIDAERVRSEVEARVEGRPPVELPDPYLETLAVYRRIAHAMADHDTLLFHGSVVAVDGMAYLFTAKSGTGKSTHTRLWQQLLGERAVIINDDKPLIRINEAGVTVYGTPWNGKHRLGENTSAPLRAVCVLERGEENAIRAVSAEEVYPLLLQQTYRPADPAVMLKVLALLDGLAAGVRLYRLVCNMDPSAARVSYEGMRPE